MARQGKDLRLSSESLTQSGKTVVHDRRQAPPESRLSSATVSSTRSRWYVDPTPARPRSRPRPRPRQDKPRRGRAARAARRRAAAARSSQGHHRPGANDRRDADLPVRPRPLPDDRRAGAGQDADRIHLGPGPAPEVQPHPVHTRPDAQRYHRHRDHRGGHRDRQARVPLRARAGLRQHRARRRDQPDSAQDPGGALAGHAGVPGHRRLEHLRPRPSVLRHGHPEPDRAGRHLSASRGPARPVHALDQHRLSQPRGRAADRQCHDPGLSWKRSGRSCPGAT